MAIAPFADAERQAILHDVGALGRSCQYERVPPRSSQKPGIEEREQELLAELLVQVPQAPCLRRRKR
jgi:hypothetical protein